MNYIKTVLKEDIIIKKIVSIHYFEYAKNYSFGGEEHDFWELVYVDKGEIKALAGDKSYTILQGEMIFHKPNEFHSLSSNGTVSPNLIIVSFECNSKEINFFKDKIIKISNSHKETLANIIKEAKNAYSSPLNDTYLEKLEKRKNPLFGSEQLIKINLEHLLITIIREGKNLEKFKKQSTTIIGRSNNELADKIIAFLEENIYSNISFFDICVFSSKSKTALKNIFKSVKGMGAMEYYRELKIEKIKSLIRDEALNFSEISQKMGYQSVHYFSRHFKKETGMTPTEYALSVKVKIENEM